MNITTTVDEIWKVLLPAVEKMLRRRFRVRGELIFPAISVADADFSQLEKELVRRLNNRAGNQLTFSTEAYGAGCKLVLRKR